MLADWDGDGDQDLVLVDGFRGRDGPAVRFLEHLDNHLVIEHPNSPFQNLDLAYNICGTVKTRRVFMNFLTLPTFSVRNMSCNIELAYGFCMADWDGDGMLDLIGFTWTSLNHGSSVGICLQARSLHHAWLILCSLLLLISLSLPPVPGSPLCELAGPKFDCTCKPDLLG